MNRSTLQTALGALAALAFGISAAFLVPRATDPAASETVKAASLRSEPVADAQPGGPLAAAYREANGAKRWLLLVSAAEHATAAEMSTLIRIARDDPAAVRMLAARWAELDPVSMFSSLYADYLLPENSPAALPSRWALTDALFEHWVKIDLHAAIKALDDVPNFSGRENLRMSMVNQALKLDVEAGLRAMGEWGIRNYIPNMESIGLWAERDPRHAAEVVLKSGAGYAAQEALKAVGKAWGKSDPAGGLQFAASLEAQSRARLGSEIVRTWTGTDQKAAAAFIAEQDMSFRAALAPGLVEAWGKTDPSAALAWSEENLKGTARTEAIAGVIKTVSKDSLKTASQLVADMAPGAAQNSACASIFETWFGRGAGERAAAFDWLESLPDPAARSAALEKVQWDWMWRDPEGVRDFISGPHGGLAPQNMINQVARNQVAKNPEAAMEWASGLSEARSSEARRSVLESWLQIRPEGATAYVSKLPSGPERENAVRTVSQNLMWQAPEQLGTWFRSLPAADQAVVRQSLDQNRLPADRQKLIEQALKGA